MLDDEPDLTAKRIAFEITQAGQVELVDQFAVDEGLEIIETLLALDRTATGAIDDR